MPIDVADPDLKPEDLYEAGLVGADGHQNVEALTDEQWSLLYQNPAWPLLTLENVHLGALSPIAEYRHYRYRFAFVSHQIDKACVAPDYDGESLLWPLLQQVYDQHHPKLDNIAKVLWAGREFPLPPKLRQSLASYSRKHAHIFSRYFTFSVVRMMGTKMGDYNERSSRRQEGCISWGQALRTVADTIISSTLPVLYWDELDTHDTSDMKTLRRNQEKLDYLLETAQEREPPSFEKIVAFQNTATTVYSY